MKQVSLVDILFEKKIILYGAGDYGIRMLMLLREIGITVSYFGDRKYGNTYLECPVLSIKQLKEIVCDEYIIIISTENDIANIIYHELLENGLDRNAIYRYMDVIKVLEQKCVSDDRLEKIKHKQFWDNIYREKEEWVNYWWESPTDRNKKRIALIGDSVSRGYRKCLNEMINSEYVLDFCGSSCHIGDTLLRKEIQFFLNADDYIYEKIIVNIGGQHGHHMACRESTEDRELFKQSYIELIEYLFKYCQDVLLVSFTPNIPNEDTRNKEILERNDVLKEIADKYSLKYIEIYALLKAGNYEYTDRIHFVKEAYVDVAKVLAEHIL